MHLVGAHLELNVHARGPYQCGVQGLVTIEFGDRNVILELAGNRFVHLVEHTQGGIAVGYCGDDHPEAINIGDLSKTQMFQLHFLINGVQRFLATREAHFHADF
ncbi:hypothetical protein D3C71_1864470 [compost metagenome]